MQFAKNTDEQGKKFALSKLTVKVLCIGSLVYQTLYFFYKLDKDKITFM